MQCMHVYTSTNTQVASFLANALLILEVIVELFYLHRLVASDLLTFLRLPWPS